MKNRNFESNIHYMIKNLWNFDKKSFMISLLLIPTRILLPLVTGIVVKVMIDAITAGITEVQMIILITGISFLIGSLTWIEPVLHERLHAVSQNLNVNYRIKSFNKMMNMSYEKLEGIEGRRKFEKSQKFVSGNGFGCVYFQFNLVNMLEAFFGIFSYIFIISAVEPILLIILSLCSIALIISRVFFLKVDARIDEDMNKMDLQDKYLFRTATSIAAGKDIREYSYKPFFIKLLNSLKEKYVSAMRFYFKKNSQSRVFIIFLTLINESSAFFFLLNGVIYKNLSVADFIFIFGLVTGMWGWLSSIIFQIYALKRASVQCGYYRDFLEMPDEVDGKNRTEKCAGVEIEEIRFENVDFTYPQATKPTINNMSFTVKKGEKIAVIGENGAGKTTCIKLLCGLYNVTNGKILVNNMDISFAQREEYFSLFSVVFQDHILLPLCIKKNITLDAKLDKDKLDFVLEKSGLKEVIDNLKNGCDTLLIKKLDDNAVDLSGGETQKLLLARALYKDSPVLILDEPTAALDPIAENNLYMKYNELTKGKISFFVSHRLSSTRFCDRIFFIANGQVAECGSHDELLAQNGGYAKMFETQSFYYRQSNNMNVGGDTNGKN